jgi:hypothetical protein
MPRVIASRRKLPPRPADRVVSVWWLIVVPALVAVACWLIHFSATVFIFGFITVLLSVAIIEGRFQLVRERRVAAERSGESTCSFARGFDFRHTDTAVMRAVYEEVQPFVQFPIRPSDRLIEDLHIDEEDLILDAVPAIARRLGRTLEGAENNPRYERVYTVADLVHFMEAQACESTKA